MKALAIDIAARDQNGSNGRLGTLDSAVKGLLQGNGHVQGRPIVAQGGARPDAECTNKGKRQHEAVHSRPSPEG